VGGNKFPPVRTVQRKKTTGGGRGGRSKGKTQKPRTPESRRSTTPPCSTHRERGRRKVGEGGGGGETKKNAKELRTHLRTDTFRGEKSRPKKRGGRKKVPIDRKKQIEESKTTRRG